jgi:hypothetical protein
MQGDGILKQEELPKKVGIQGDLEIDGKVNLVYQT